MRLRRLSAAALAAAALLMTAAAHAQTPNRREGDLKVGDAAPEFELKDVEGRTTVRLSDLRGKPVVLVFGSCT